MKRLSLFAGVLLVALAPFVSHADPSVAETWFFADFDHPTRLGGRALGAARRLTTHFGISPGDVVYDFAASARNTTRQGAMSSKAKRKFRFDLPMTICRAERMRSGACRRRN